MTAQTDRTNGLSRERLCLLAGVERGRHRRWQEGGLLARKPAYGEIDLIKAAALDHLHQVLKPATARDVWAQTEADLGIPGARMDIVVRLADRHASVVRSDAQLAAAMPRDEAVVVVQLDQRVNAARERYRAFRQRREPSPSQALTAAIPRTQGSEATSSERG